MSVILNRESDIAKISGLVEIVFGTRTTHETAGEKVPSFCLQTESGIRLTRSELIVRH